MCLANGSSVNTQNAEPHFALDESSNRDSPASILHKTFDPADQYSLLIFSKTVSS